MNRYRYALNSKVKGYIEWQLEHYKEDKKQLERYKLDIISTPSPSTDAPVQGGSIESSTERTAMRLATSAYILSTERSLAAVEAVLAKCDETDIKLIDLVYWRRTLTVTGAGMKIGLSKSGAYNRVNRILVMIATEMGIVGP